MSKESRLLQVGDKVFTFFSNKWTAHEITERIENWRSQSRIGFKVMPPVPKSSGDFIDADWFEPNVKRN